MNNEIGRKLTSLTLMTIMLASGFGLSATSVMPSAAAANANLFVSAENSQFQNYFAGPQVIEVVVIDSDIKDTDKGKGEPDVTINGNKLRMAQATDGNWYGYFADRAMAQKADATAASLTAAINGTGLDFGVFCSPASATTLLGASFTQTVGVALARQLASGTAATVGSQGETSTAATIETSCSASRAPLSNLHNNVVRENKTLNAGTSSIPVGQIFTRGTFHSSYWPIIQLYNFNPTGNVVVQYNKGGGVQSTTLKFDTVDQFASISLDRAIYPLKAQVHATVTDIQLNIDPTDEDSWSFGTISTNQTTFYQLFTEDGSKSGDGKHSRSLTGNLTGLMFEDNGKMALNKDVQSSGTDIVLIQDNSDSIIAGSGDVDTATTSTINVGDQPITITESAPNTGIFGTYDENDVSVLQITSSAPRGKSATITYNDVSYSILVGFGFATVDIDSGDAEWNSGEKATVTITDSDANKNSRADEDLDLYNVYVPLIPSMRIGTPFTLGQNGTGTTGTINAVTFVSSNTGTSLGTLSTSVQFQPRVSDQSIHSVSVQKYSDRAILTTSGRQSVTGLAVSYGKTVKDLKEVVYSTNSSSATRLHGFDLFNFDIRGLSNSTITNVDSYLAFSNATRLLSTSTTTANTFRVISMANDTASQALVNLNKTSATNTRVLDKLYGLNNNNQIGVVFTFDAAHLDTDSMPIVADFFSFGYVNDGDIKSDRVNNMIVRIEAEETGDNTSVFQGSLQFVMLNQLNILSAGTYTGLSPIGDGPSFIVHQDLDDEEAPRVNYNDLGTDGVTTQVSDQEEAPTHSGVVSFDKPTYKIADTVVITLDDQDLNTDVDLIDIYTTVESSGNALYDVVGATGLPILSNGDALGRLLDITFDDERWLKSGQAGSTGLTCSGNPSSGSNGLADSGFTLVETGPATGVFIGDFQIPSQYCARASGTGTLTSTTGKDLEVNYVDFRDASGQIVEVGDGAGIRANTGSVSLDRTVYPVPWGTLDDDSDGSTGATSPNGLAVFPLHATAIAGNINDAAEVLGNGDLTIHVQVNDPDYDVSAAGEDTISEAGTGLSIHGPVKVTITRSSSTVILATAGYNASNGNVGKITVGTSTVDETGAYQTRELGPITETSPSSGIFEFDLDIRFTDGPSDTSACPATEKYLSANNSTRGTSQLMRFAQGSSTDTAPSGRQCILQGDIITVEYTDATDSSGNANTVTDSATFDLRNGALQSDKSVYIIGSDMILTLIEPDFDLDNDMAEVYDLDLIEWDSDAATCTMGDRLTNGGCETTDSFDPEPSDLRETGDSTGIFQSVIEIPSTLDTDRLQRGEEIVLEYTDWGPSGADFVGDEDEDVNLTIFTSNFGATVELDQKVYTWTDKVYITIVAPDHNYDSNLVDTIGDTANDAVKVATRGHDINQYHLVETGTDTGIFTGEVILIGFTHDADGLSSTGTNGNDGPFGPGSDSADDTGPTNGFLQADDDDGLTVSFEFSADETVVGSALIRWNIGEVSWIEASYPASGTGVVRVIDPDMNWNPEAIDNFGVDVWSDSDAGGIDLTVTETNEATGIFEGTVFFTTTSDSSGHRLRVAEGDTVTAEYKDNTLPDPYTTADELDITGTAFIGTVVPPLERAPASNARVVDAFGNTLDEVSVDQQVQITADLTNGQDREQPFAYLVQIQDENGVTASLAWITGSLSAGQSFSPALSWIATAPGTYTATVFVWESVDNPTALSPPESVDITVS